MKEESYHDQIQRAFRKATKERNAEAIVYYGQAFNLCACVSFDTFKGAWAFDSWRKKNAEEIRGIEESFKRFSYLYS